MWLTLIEGLNIEKYINLIEYFKTNKNIFYANKNDLMNVKLINEKLADNIINTDTKSIVEKHLKYMDENKIDIIFIGDKEYPNILKQIYDPPICIYIKGNKKIFEHYSFGIIGCRDCTEYGKKIAKDFAYKLSKQNINIVSGLSKGIDGQVHWGAVYAKGLTTAVLGCGLDIIYPKENTYLADRIIKSNGAIISEYPLGTQPLKMNFPARNRIISGLSKGILVVEAKEKSGTSITVDFALEQGREVFAIPRKH